MEKNKKGIIFDLFIIVLVSLIPFLWLYGGYIILGHDAGVPINPSMHFLDRLSTWTHRYGLGENQTYAIPGFFLHGLEYVLTKTGFNISTQQILSFILYFILIGISMYIFARSFFRDKVYLPLFAAVLYQVNHFLLQAWFVAERTKFTTYIALPLLLFYLYSYLFKEKKPIKTALFTALTLFVFNGGGFLPLYGAILITVPFFILFLFFLSEKRIQFLKFIGIYVVLTGILSIGLHAFWLFPYITYIPSTFAGEVAKTGGINGIINWIYSISQYTSYLNIFRLQGIQEWYVNEFHPYSAAYLNNLFLILVSFLLPIGAYSSFLLTRIKTEKQKLLFFGVLSLIAVFFMAGSHKPFGDLYLLLIKYVPGFIAFRTPFYKFAPALWLSYAMLIGFTVDYLIQRYIHIRYSFITKISYVTIIILYCYPILSGGFLNYYENRTTKVKVPQYIFDYSKWANSSAFDFRRLIIAPPVNQGTYAVETSWDYWSLTPLHALIDKRSYVDLNISYSQTEQQMIKEMYDLLLQNDDQWKGVASVLNADGIIFHNDIPMYINNNQKITPELYKNVIDIQQNISLEHTFGNISVFRIAAQKQPAKLFDGYYRVYNEYDKLPEGRIVLPEINLNTQAILSEDPEAAAKLKIGEIILPQCIHCNLIEEGIDRGDTNITVFPGSKLYDYKLQKEQSERDKIQDINAKMIFELQILWKRYNEVEWVIANETDSSKKFLGFTQYYEQLQRLKNVAKQFIHTNPINDSANETLTTLYDTLITQNNLLRNHVQLITGNRLEGIAYFEALNYSVDFANRLKPYMVYTDSVFIKKYMVNLTNTDSYDVYLKTDTLVINENPQELTLNINDTQNTTTIDPKQYWNKITTVKLNKGHHNTTLTLSDENPAFVKTYPTTESLNFNNDICREIPLGILKKGQHLFKADITTNSLNTEVSYFISESNAKNPYLPYWGTAVRLNKNLPETINHEVLALSDNDYVLSVCQFDNIPNFNIKVSDMTITYAAEPQLVFVSKNDSYKPSNTRIISSKENTNTNYSVDISKGGTKLLMLDQRFDNFWQANSTVDVTKTRINYYANGWIVPASDKDVEIELDYTLQSKYKLGTYVSGITLGLILLFVGTSYLVKKIKTNGKK